MFATHFLIEISFLEVCFKDRPIVVYFFGLEFDDVLVFKTGQIQFEFYAKRVSVFWSRVDYGNFNWFFDLI